METIDRYPLLKGMVSCEIAPNSQNAVNSQNFHQIQLMLLLGLPSFHMKTHDIIFTGYLHPVYHL